MEELENQLTRLENDVEAFTVAISRLAVGGASSTPSDAATSSTGDRAGTLRTTASTSFLEQQQPGTLSHTALLWSVVVLAAVVVLVLVLTQWFRRPRKSGRPVDREAPNGDWRAKGSPPPCDVAFLCHPALILSVFAFWLPESRPLRRWRSKWWMVPAWPFCVAFSVWTFYLSPSFVEKPHLPADRFEHKGILNEVWIFRAFSYQYMISALRGRIARGIEATVREADRSGVAVLGLGALNKAEFINHGGEDIVRSVAPRKTRIVHGNTLTAAVVVENVKQAAERRNASDDTTADGRIAGVTEHTAPWTRRSDARRGRTSPPRVFLTGATSKVGRAVTLKLAMDGYDVVCCTSSDERFASLERELKTLCSSRGGGGGGPENTVTAPKEGFHKYDGAFSSCGGAGARTKGAGVLLRARRVDEGVYHRFWVVGKYDASVRLHVPLGASAVVFAVPCPLEGHRPDVSVIPGGIVRMDVSLCSPRRFHMLLPFDQLYACHAAAIVHHRMGWRHHEVGKVHVSEMEMTLRAAQDCGFHASLDRRQPYLYPSTALVEVHKEQERQGCVGERPAPYNETFLPRPSAGSTRLRDPPYHADGNFTASPEELPAKAINTPDIVSTTSQTPPQPGRRATHVETFRGGGGGAASPRLASGSALEDSLSVAATASDRTAGDEGNLLKSSSLQKSVPALPEYCRVVVVGGGASGLSAAACLRCRGEKSVLVLERSDKICGVWSDQYESLSITTRRAYCGLPGWPVPPNDETVMSAERFVRYLEGYRRRFDLDVVTGVEVFRADREGAPGLGNRGAATEAGNILVRFCLDKKIFTIRCEHLVVATGKNSLPKMPPSVFHSLRGFAGEVVHSSKVQGLAERAKAGGRICIVGMGNSACDLAVALLLHGAGKVHLSTRSSPPIIMRQWGPLSLEWVASSVQYVPAWIIDRMLDLVAAAKWGKGWRAKVFPSEVAGRTWGPRAMSRIPCVDKGHLVEALLDGRISVHGPIESCEGHTLRFMHSGSSESVGSVSTVILATGFDPAYDMWLSPGLLADGPQGGVHMVGFENGRALLPLRQIGIEANQAAARIAPRSLGPR